MKNIGLSADAQISPSALFLKINIMDLALTREHIITLFFSELIMNHQDHSQHQIMDHKKHSKHKSGDHVHHIKEYKKKFWASLVLRIPILLLS